MALAIKGLQYFPLDVNFFENNKIAIIISDYGLEATAVVLKLFSQIYKSGYYMDWNEKIGKIFSASFHTKYSYATIMNLVNSLVEEDIFNKKMYEEYHILTSEKIQNCYFSATVRRKKQKISNPEYLLIADMISSSTTPKEHLNDNSVDKNPKIACNFQQSKVDKSKVDKSKGKESINNHTHIARESEKIRSLKAEWDQWKMEMLNDEDWCATLVRYSGKGILILNNAYQIMKCFDDYVILRSSENTIQTKKDYQSGLFGWWRYNNWETDLQILTGAKAAMIENKCSAPRTTQKTSKIEEAMAVAERASEMAYQLMQQNPL
ncbi:DUF4373 domain-containing protein [Parabacteroides sp. AD58]|uniref:DUF4373 domain-containing protein n=1 Tax=Parabacteroides absconsus TaxID=2951805 RepID=A0ABZ2IS22_9BACT